MILVLTHTHRTFVALCRKYGWTSREARHAKEMEDVRGYDREKTTYFEYYWDGASEKEWDLREYCRNRYKEWKPPKGAR